MAQSSFPFDTFPEAKDQSLLKVLGERRAGENKARRRFRELATKIELRRGDLQGWKDYLLRYNQRVAAELEPLRRRLVAAQLDMALLIDELLTRPAGGQRLARKYRNKLRELLTTLLDALADDDSDALRSLRDKYRDPTSEEDRLLDMDFTRGLLESLGVDLDDDHGARNSEELMEYARQLLQEREEEAREAARQRQARGEERTRARPKSAKAQAAEAKREQAARAVSQSLREVFRKLASALHPDREPDPEERLRKNELMQEANRAYEAKDLLTLLDLQLRTEQIDAAHLSLLGTERLGHYNQILREQLAELEAEVARINEPFRFLCRPGGQLTPEEVDRAIDGEKAELREALEQLRDDLVIFRDPKRLRGRLDEWHAFDEFPFDDADEQALDELLALIQEAPTPRPRGRKRGGKRRNGERRRG